MNNSAEPKVVPKPSEPGLITRREALVGGATMAVVTAGCPSKRAVIETPPPSRQDVALRVAMMGTEQDADVLSRGWGSVMSQPLKIQTLAVDRATASGIGAKFVELSKRSDVLIYPLLGTADLAAAEALMPTNQDEFKANEQELGRVAVGLRNGAAMYGGNIVATPLGALLPALLSTEAIDPIESWQDYDSWVEDVDGSAAEPLAPGWAGMMFLWRVASTLDSGWLFSGEGMAPLVDSEPYVAALQQMKQTVAKYRGDRLTPAEIWRQIQSGTMKGGIGFQTIAGIDVQVTIHDLPGAASTKRILLDPFSPVVSLSSSCRQTGASKQFAKWLTGGEGSDAVRRQIPGMTAARVQDFAAAPDQQQSSAYATWLSDRLKNPITLSALQLLSGGQYYAALDQQIGECLRGGIAPQVALNQVAERWRTITESVGLEKQERAWRRAQGMQI